MLSLSLNSISKSNSNSDLNKKPLTFLDWSKLNLTLSLKERNDRYKIYLSDFYKEKVIKNDSIKQKLKNDYVDLLKKIGILFKDDLEFQRYTTIDFDSDLDLSIAIPKYAQRLKEIALFYVSKRNELKTKKIEYSLIGSEGGLYNIIRNKLISNFTNNSKSKFNNENPLITQSPIYSSIQDDFDIEIEELYSTVDNYHQQKELNPFACLFNSICSDLYSSPISGYADPIKQLTCDYNTEKVESLLQTAYSKYLGTNTYYISGGYYSEKEIDVSLDFPTGDTYFYWFSGRSLFEIPEGMYKDLPINNIDWNSTGAETIDNADIIFTSIGNEVNGAWFQQTDYIQTSATMIAKVENGRIFKFPFPNYGVSAYNGDWSGPSLVDNIDINKEFYPTEEDFINKQNIVDDLYWTSFSSISTVIPINLQETTLGQTGGYASNEYVKADKVFISKSTDRTKYSNPINGWLFQLGQTQLPIKSGENKLYFPLKRYTENSELFFDYSEGESIQLSALNIGESFAGAIAGETLELSDMIIKNQTICGPEIEAAWLKAQPLSFLNDKSGSCSCIDETETFATNWIYVSGGVQNALSFINNPGQYTRFTWTDETTNINELKGFTGFDHDDACPYKNINHSISLFDKNFLDDGNKDIFERWKKCTCRSVQHSPFGHSGSFLSLGIVPDFIVLDTDYPNIFNSSTWKGTDGNFYTDSIDSARFIPNNIIEKDAGWGAGKWSSFRNTPFLLEKGKSYIYHRAIINNCNFESPYFLINQQTLGTRMRDNNCDSVFNSPVWMKAVKNSDGEWIDTGEVSNMIMNFGDFISYIHRDSRVEVKQKLLYAGNDISSLSGSFINLNPTDENISIITSEITIPSINFVIKIPLHGNKPYWGSSDSNIVQLIDDYLPIYQPEPLNILLDQNTIIEYRQYCNQSCFIWEQPLSFNTYYPIKRWNKIFVDNYVQSEILQYLTKEVSECNTHETQRCQTDCSNTSFADCSYSCYVNKQGLTASNIESDLTFNVEVSGLPYFIHYKSLNNFQQNITITDITNGLSSIWNPAISGTIADASYPWRELLNLNNSKFIVEEIEEFKNNKDMNLFIPENVGMNKYETLNGDFTLANTSELTTFSDENYFGEKLFKKKKDSKELIYSSDGLNSGTPLDKFQNFTPYSKKYGVSDMGLYDQDLDFSPWTNGKSLDSYKNIRNQINLNCSNGWFTNNTPLTGDVFVWDGDIFGNNYFLSFNESIDFKYGPSTFGQIYIKTTDNHVSLLQNILSASFAKYKNIVFIDDETYLVTEDGLILITEDNFSFTL